MGLLDKFYLWILGGGECVSAKLYTKTKDLAAHDELANRLRALPEPLSLRARVRSSQ